MTVTVTTIIGVAFFVVVMSFDDRLWAERTRGRATARYNNNQPRRRQQRNWRGQYQQLAVTTTDVAFVVVVVASIEHLPPEWSLSGGGG